MRHKTRKCLVFNYLIVMGLMALVATGPALAEPEVMAELTSVLICCPFIVAIWKKRKRQHPRHNPTTLCRLRLGYRPRR